MESVDRVPFTQRYTPDEFVEHELQTTQGPKPGAWARDLGLLVMYGQLTVKQARPYAEALGRKQQELIEQGECDSSQGEFWKVYNEILAKS